MAGDGRVGQVRCRWLVGLGWVRRRATDAAGRDRRLGAQHATHQPRPAKAESSDVAFATEPASGAAERAPHLQLQAQRTRKPAAGRHRAASPHLYSTTILLVCPRAAPTNLLFLSFSVASQPQQQEGAVQLLCLLLIISFLSFPPTRSPASCIILYYIYNFINI